MFFWPRLQLERGEDLSLLHGVVSILVFLASSATRTAIRRVPRKHNFVSILVFLARLQLDGSLTLLRHPIEVEGFNPCFSGLVCNRKSEVEPTLMNVAFQSLFFWPRLQQELQQLKELQDEMRFQSLFFWPRLQLGGRA